MAPLDNHLSAFLRADADPVNSRRWQLGAVGLDGDLEAAEYVILGDNEYDAKSVALEERCFTSIALQAPVASDLRSLVSAIKIVADVERSADLCVNICKAARRIYGHELDPSLRGVIQKMGDQARALFKEATDAYLHLRYVRTPHHNPLNVP